MFDMMKKMGKVNKKGKGGGLLLDFMFGLGGGVLFGVGFLLFGLGGIFG